jgi:hypothetical protein
MKNHRPAARAASPREILVTWLAGLVLVAIAVSAPALWHAAYPATLGGTGMRHGDAYVEQHGLHSFHARDFQAQRGRRDLHGCWDRPWSADPRDGYEFC